MNSIENYLSKIDKKQRGMIYASIVILVLLVCNTLVTPMVEEQQQLVAQIDVLQTSVAKNKTNVLKKEIALASKELLTQTSETEAQKEKITFLLSSLYGLQYAFFNEKEFASALDEILQKSINAKLGIDYIKRVALKNEDGPRIVKHKKRLEITGTGGFKEIISLINHIENLTMLLKFENISLKASENQVKFTLIVDVYGIGL